MGLPVSTAGLPRRRPSVLVIATARTQSLPRCCCTSTTNLPPVAFSASVPSVGISTALYISGNWSGGNSMSTTGPVICTTFPVAAISLSYCVVRSTYCVRNEYAIRNTQYVLPRLCGCAAGNLYYLFCDVCLAEL